MHSANPIHGLIVILLLAACGSDPFDVDGGLSLDAGPTVDTGAGCDEGALLCDDECAPVQFDPTNCGACGNVCANGEVCTAGSCATFCGVGITDCDGACVDTDIDPANCGGCAMACAAGEMCSAGTCGTTCGDNTLECGGSCVDAENSTEHCGACDASCGAGETCTAGVCALTCGGGATLCSDMCVNTDSDAANCGACDAACGAEEMCSAGTCTFACVGGATMCGSTCVDMENDPSNCGACDASCAAGDFCSAGTCTTLCMAPRTACGDACVDTESDPSNCGACGMVCGDTEACVVGECERLSQVARFVYLANWAGGSTDFDVYNVETSTWSEGAPLPVRSRGQLASDGTAVSMMGSDGNIYQYDVEADVWTLLLAGPDGSAITSLASFHALGDNFYLCRVNDTTLNIYSEGAWSTVTLDEDCALTGGVDPAAGEVYIKHYGTASFTVVDAATNALRFVAEATAITENTASGSVLGGVFYTRSRDGQIFAIDGASGARTDTGRDPGGIYTAFHADHRSGVIYMHSLDGFSTYDPATGLFAPLTTGPTQSSLGTIAITH